MKPGKFTDIIKWTDGDSYFQMFIFSLAPKYPITEAFNF